ncbi:MAG: hypothetical protein IAF38_21845 [Bacteroidia bacterium]|nr:hypothetical protein [Bacteroidia bacterium]
MKFLGLIFFFLTNLLFAQTESKIILQGNYLGKNLYIQNPFDSKGNGFCTKKVLVNGKEYPIDSTKSTAYEIDLKWLGFKDGDTLRIEIFHSDNCKPKVLNTPGSPRRNNILKIRIEKDSFLVWQTKGEKFNYPFYVEQFRWNKWVRWEKVDTLTDTGDTITYRVNIKKYLHSGKNEFRVLTLNFNQPRPSQPVFVTRPKEKLAEVERGGKYYFTHPVDLKKVTHWELYDQYGNLLKQGYSQTLFINDLKKGSYYLNFDNKMTEIAWY